MDLLAVQKGRISTMSMVSFMPWCRIDKAYDVGEVKILPFERHEPIDGLDEAAQCRLEFTVTVKADTASNLVAELNQILQELGLGEAVRVE